MTYLNPTMVWAATGRCGDLVDRKISRLNPLLAMAAVAVVVVATGVWSHAGLGPTVVVTAVGGVLWTVIAARRRAPQLIGVLVSTVGWVTVLGLLGMAVVPMALGGAVPSFIVVYPALLTAVTSMALLAPHRGIHVGWSVAVAQASVMAALPVSIVRPLTTWEMLAQLAGFVTATVLVYRRARLADRTPELRRSRRILRRCTRLLGLAMVVFIASISMMLGGGAKASALPFGIDDSISNKVNDMLCSFTRPDLTPEPVGTGPESMVPARNMARVKTDPALGNPTTVPAWSDQAGNFDRLGRDYSLDNYTLFEISGLRGLRFVNWQKNDQGKEECSVMPWMSVTIGNLMMKFNTYLLQAVIALKEMSQSPRPLEFLYDKTIPLVDGFYNYLFLPAGSVMFTLTAIAVATKAFSGNGFREALGMTGGSALVLALGAFMFAGLAGSSWTNSNGNGFFTVAQTADTLVAQANSGIAELAFSTLNLTGQDMMCQNPVAVPDSGEDSTTRATAPGQRYSSCILAESLAYREWAIGQFGKAANKPITPAAATKRFGDPRASGNVNLVTAGDASSSGLPCYNNYRGCKDLRTYLIAQEGGPRYFAAQQKCMADKDDYVTLVQCEPYHAVANQILLKLKLGEKNPVAAANAMEIGRAYTGQGAFPHVTQALVGLVGTGFTLVGVGVIAVITLFWHAWLFVLFLLGVPRLLWGAYPGKAKVAWTYIGECINCFTMRLAYGGLSTIMILLIAYVFASSMNMGFKILWMVAILIGMMKALKKVQEVAKVKGSEAPGPANSISRTMSTSGLIGGYFAGKGGIAAGKGVGRVASKTLSGARSAVRPERTAASAAAPSKGDSSSDTAAAPKSRRERVASTGRAAKRVGAAVTPTIAKPLVRDLVSQGGSAGRNLGRSIARPAGDSIAKRLPGNKGRPLSSVVSGYRQTIKNEARGAVATFTPRLWEGSMGTDTKDTLDRWSELSTMSKFFAQHGRSSFSEAGERSAFVSRMVNTRISRRRYREGMPSPRQH